MNRTNLWPLWPTIVGSSRCLKWTRANCAAVKAESIRNSTHHMQRVIESWRHHEGHAGYAVCIDDLICNRATAGCHCIALHCIVRCCLCDAATWSLVIPHSWSPALGPLPRLADPSSLSLQFSHTLHHPIQTLCFV